MFVNDGTILCVGMIVIYVCVGIIVCGCVGIGFVLV